MRSLILHIRRTFHQVFFVHPSLFQIIIIVMNNLGVLATVAQRAAVAGIVGGQPTSTGSSVVSSGVGSGGGSGNAVGVNVGGASVAGVVGGGSGSGSGSGVGGVVQPSARGCIIQTLLWFHEIIEFVFEHALTE